MKRTVYIGVIGGREVSAGVLKAAEEAGREIARRKAVLVCGGLGGVMEAACRGARSEGGTTVGILPTESGADANAFVDIAIATGMGFARNAVIVHTCDAVIAVGGRYGTLSEIAFALQKGIPVASLKSWECDPGIRAFDSPREAVEWIFGRL